MIAATPLWLPLVVAGLGLLGTIVGTIGGVLVAQRRADQRESVNWSRERERERAIWSREDAARTFEHRREAYTDFYEAVRAMASRASTAVYGSSRFELEFDWFQPTYEKLQHLRVYATPSVA